MSANAGRHQAATEQQYLGTFLQSNKQRLTRYIFENFQRLIWKWHQLIGTPVKCGSFLQAAQKPIRQLDQIPGFTFVRPPAPPSAFLGHF